MFSSLLPLLSSGFALGFCAAALFAFTDRVQTDLAQQVPARATKPQPVSAVWTLLVAALLGLVYGNSWPHFVVLAIGGALFASGWVREQRLLRWAFAMVFFSSMTIRAPSPAGHGPTRFSSESFADPMLLLLLVVAVAVAALLFRLRPRHAAREIGAASLHRERSDGAVWFDMILFALLLLGTAFAASAWPWSRPSDATFLAAAPLGVCHGAGLSFVLLSTARIEAAYRGLDPRRRENLQLFAIGALGVEFLVLIGLELRLLGPALFIGYLATAGILIASPSVSIVPPNLAIWFPKLPPQPSPARPGR